MTKEPQALKVLAHVALGNATEERPVYVFVSKNVGDFAPAHLVDAASSVGQPPRSWSEVATTGKR